MMRRTLGAAVVLSTLTVGCGGGDPVELCKESFQADEACYEEAFGQASGNDLEGLCDLYSLVSGTDKKESADAFQCSIDAWESADCSTEDGYYDAVDASNACFPDE